MITKTALKSVVRTPLKTALFLVLLAAATALLCLGAGMSASGDALQKDADEAYSTIAQIEYMGENYPDTSFFGDAMVKELLAYDATPLGESENVLLFDEPMSMGGVVEGLLTGTRGRQEYKDLGVIEFRVKYMSDEMGVYCAVVNPLFADTDRFREGTSFILDTTAIQGLDVMPEQGKRYVGHGVFTANDKRVPVFNVIPVDLVSPVAYNELRAVPVWDVTGVEDYRERSEYGFFTELAKSYNVLENAVNIYATDYIEGSNEFNLGETTLLEGRFFTDEEVARGDKVCIVSDFITKPMGISLGDSISIDFFNEVPGVNAGANFWAAEGYMASGDYRIVGVYRGVAGLYTNVYMPKDKSGMLTGSNVSYNVARVKLKNGTAEAYKAEIEPLLLNSMRVTIYDQGYAQMQETINSLKATANLLLWVCGVCTAALLFLYCYLFVTKQNDSVRVMLCLGAGKKRAVRFLVTSAFSVLLCAVAVGGLMGALVSDDVTAAAYADAATRAESDSRFGTPERVLNVIEFNAPVSTDPTNAAVMCGGVVAAGAVLIVAFSAVSAVKCDRRGGEKRKKGRRRKGVGEADKQAIPTSAAPVSTQIKLRAATPVASVGRRMLFPAKSVFRTVRRNGVRSLIVPVVSLLLTAFIGVFCADLASYEKRLENTYDSVPVTAWMSDVYGKQTGNLSIKKDVIEPVLNSGYIGESYLVQKSNYELIEINPKDVEATIQQKVDWFESLKGFAVETYVGVINYMPLMYGVQDIDYTPEFVFEPELHVKYLEGYDENVLRSDEKVCIVSEHTMREKGIELGDTLLVGIYKAYDLTISSDFQSLKVVGSFEGLTGRNTIYCPIELLRATNMFTDEIEIEYNRAKEMAAWDLYDRQRRRGDEPDFPFLYLYEGNYMTITNIFGEVIKKVRFEQNYTAAYFTLKNTKQLSDFKDMLEADNYGTVGKLTLRRISVVIDDGTLTETVNGLTRHISYMRALFAVIYVLIVAVGFIVSTLVTKSRKPEYAMMRSMGAGRSFTFACFLLEQTALCLTGVIVGAIAIFALYGAAQTSQTEAILGYFGCYVAGAAVAAVMMNKNSVLEILSEKE